jgi:hypothetical protein
MVFTEVAVLGLLDQVAESVLVARPLRDDNGRVIDFRIDHLSPNFTDPAGRAPADLARLTLLAAYPASVPGRGMFDRALGVLADGRAQYVPGMADDSRVSLTDLHVAPFLDGVVFTWRAGPDAELPTRLQRTLLPPDPVVAMEAGLNIAVRYRPAGSDEAAGDWYDVVQMPDGDILLVVGDIAGHGMAAVTGMVAARNALRGLAAAGQPTAEVLRQLNYGGCHLSNGVTGTIVCVRYNPATRVATWARAGHLPPVLVRDGAASALELPEGMMLGVDPDAGYEERTLDLFPGDSLVLYTDGVIERRADSISDALADLVTAAVPSDQCADTHAARILASAAPDTGDDACLLVVRVL